VILNNDSLEILEKLDMIKLATIDLRSDNDFRQLVEDSIKLDYFNERISFTLLKRYYNLRFNSLLLTKMEDSYLNNGGDPSKVAQLSALTDSFTVGDFLIRPVLNIPFNDEVNLTLDPLIGTSWFQLPDSLSIKDYSTDDEYSLNETSKYIAKTNPTWLISYRAKTNENPWEIELPWKRCYCAFQSSGVPGGISSVGICNGAADGYKPRCDRADWTGDCPGDACDPGSIGGTGPGFGIKWN